MASNASRSADMTPWDDEEFSLDDYVPPAIAGPTVPPSKRVGFTDPKFRPKIRPRDRWRKGFDRVREDVERLSNEFTYGPLEADWIRLLLLHPGDGEDIRCTVLKERLDDRVKEKYDALSYHWGIDDPTHKIIITNKASETDQRYAMGPPPPTHPEDKWTQLYRETSVATRKRKRAPENTEMWMNVRSNLYSALHNLRKPIKDSRRPMNDARLLWIDAICIDQDNEKEKREQVSKMAQIYNSARNVCIWLGPNDRKTDAAIAFVRKVVHLPDFESSIKSKETRDDWLNLKYLMITRWFSRRWVVQEIASARHATVHCGKEEINWDDFADVVALFMKKAEQIRGLFDNPEMLGDVEALGASVLVNTISDITRKSEEGDIEEHLVGIETLVSSLLFFATSSPHDMIYSLLSLARDTPQGYLSITRDTPEPPDSPVQRKRDRGRGSLGALSHNSEADGHFAPAVDLEKDDLEATNNVLKPSDAPFQIEVDYEKDPLEVLVEFTQKCVETSKSLDIICRNWAPDVAETTRAGLKKETVFPSWIKKLSKSAYGGSEDTLQGRRGGNSLVGCPHRDPRKTYNATLGTEAIFRFHQQSLTLVNEEPKSVKRSMSHDSMLGFTHFAEGPATSSVPGDADEGSPSHKLKRPVLQDSPEPVQDLPQAGQDAMEYDSDNEQFVPKLLISRYTFSRIARAGTSLGIHAAAAQDVRWALDVKGFEVGRIRTRSSPLTHGWIHSSWLTQMGWVKGAQKVPDMLWRTLVADRDPDGLFPPRWYSRACLHCLCDEGGVMNVNGDLGTQRVPRDSDIMRQFLNRVKTVVWGRQLFVASAGEEGMLFGLAPEDAGVGDLVCVLAGCTVPVILRRVEGLQCYELIGECYVWNMMDGEAIAQFDYRNPEKLATQLKWLTLI